MIGIFDLMLKSNNYMYIVSAGLSRVTDLRIVHMKENKNQKELTITVNLHS